MTIHARRQTNVSKQTTLFDGIDGGPPKQRVCWHGLNRPFHEAMNNISNVKVHLKTLSGNVNIHSSTQSGQSLQCSKCEAKDCLYMTTVKSDQTGHMSTGQSGP